jgi:translation initiation factor IF-3
VARVLINEQIVADEVRLYDEDGVELGLVAKTRALALARERNRDLVQDEIFSSPPRCRLVPIGETTGRAARAERIAAGGAPKEIRVSTTMGAHDVETRRRQAAGLLDKGYTVKLTARLAKAERANPAKARALLEGLSRDLAEEGRVERKPFGESGALSMLLAPRDESIVDSR